MTAIPIGITARNEARNILALLASLRASVERAVDALHLEFELHLLLNDNADNTAQLVEKQPDIRIWQTRGGIVEAQRALAEARPGAPWVIFSDADILIHPDTISEICQALLQNPSIQIAYAEKYPLPPLRRSPLARALYLYNKNEGYQTRRNYCNGQCFAIRRWHIPKPQDLHWDASADTPFLHLAAGIRADDIYLSRDVLAKHGPGAFECTPSGIQYRPPETLRGMFRKYQRMRLEIERINHYFPGTAPVHQKWGRRRLDLTLIRQAALSEKLYYGLFQSALALCKLAYYGQWLYYTHIAKRPCPTWLPVTESKEPIH